MRKKVLALSTVLAVVLMVLGAIGVAYGNPTYYAALTAKCPTAPCTSCHTNTAGPPPFTAYGQAFANIATHSTDPGGAIATLGCPNGAPPPLSLSLNPTTLPAGTQGTAYSQNVTMSATGGTSPYTFTCSGSGVAGLTASASGATCTVSGTPTATGTFTVNFGVTDAAAATASSTLSFNVGSAGTSLSLSLNPNTLPDGTQGTAYSQNVTMSATGGKSPYTFTCSGSGVAGLTASASGATCTVSGTPTATGTFTVNFGVTDAAAATASSSLSFNIASAAAATIPLPIGEHVFAYPPVNLPVLNLDPAQAKPIGVGPVADGGNTIDVAVNIGPFAGPVDVTLGVYAVGIDAGEVFLLNETDSFVAASAAVIASKQGKKSSSEDEGGEGEKNERLVIWRKNVTSVNENVFGPAALSALPSGLYVVVLGVTPSGSKHKDDNYYHWVTYFIVP